MPNFNIRLRELRNSKGLSQQQLADIVGMSKSSINMYERGDREPGLELLEAFADYFNVDMDYLIGKTNNPRRNLVTSNKSDNAKLEEDIQNLYSFDNILPIKKKKFPILGEIACGKPIYCNEDYETYIEVSGDIQANFCLIAKGDSMINARIFDGDIIFVKKQPIVQNGEIAAVIIEDEVTLKKVYIKADKIILCPENPLYDDLIYEKEDMNSVKILGKAVAFQSLIR